MTEYLIIDLALFLYAVILPGIAMARLWFRADELLLTITFGTAIGVFTLPLLAFSLAVMMRTHISATFIFAQGTAVLAIAGGILWKRRRTNLDATTGS